MTRHKVLGFVVALCALFGCDQQMTAEQAQAVHVKAREERVAIDLSKARGEVSLARNFYFIFDSSGSMNSSCSGETRFPSKLAGAKWAVGEFSKKIPKDVNIGLYAFDYSSSGREIVSLGANKQLAFSQAVNSLQSGGNTPLAAAIRFGTDRLVEQYKKQLGYGEYRLIVVTDGEADSVPDMQRAVEVAMRYGIPIYSIGLCIPLDNPLRRLSVSYAAAGNADELAKGLEETIAEAPSFDPSDFVQ